MNGTVGPGTTEEEPFAITIGILKFMFELQGIVTLTSKTYSKLMIMQPLTVDSTLKGIVRFLPAQDAISPGIIRELPVLAITMFDAFFFPAAAVNTVSLRKTRSSLICLELWLLTWTPYGIISPGENPPRGKFTVIEIDPNLKQRKFNRFDFSTATGSLYNLRISAPSLTLRRHLITCSDFITELIKPP